MNTAGQTHKADGLHINNGRCLVVETVVKTTFRPRINGKEEQKRG